MNRWIKGLAVGILGLYGVTGCGIGDRLAALKGEFNQISETPSMSIQIETPQVPDAPVISDGEPAPDPGGTVSVSLYFADQSGATLVAEQRNVQKVEGIGRAVIQELLKGPVQPELAEAVPQNTQLLDINIKEDGLAIVDFSKELAEGLSDSSTAEKMAVYSIVNTLTQFPSVNRVQIRVEGKNVNTLKGAVRLDQELIQNSALVTQAP
jgi:spore germination protein GerM